MTYPADLPRAAAMAGRVLLRRNVDALPVDPLPILRACRDTRVYTLDEAKDVLSMPPEVLDGLFRDADAVTLREERDGSVYYIVLYRLDGHPARLRFTLAHELGHRVLGHRDSTPAEEREADCFASHLLCPEPVLQRFSSPRSPERAEQLARLCYISLSCARQTLRRPELPLPETLMAALTTLLEPALDCLTKPRPKAE